MMSGSTGVSLLNSKWVPMTGGKFGRPPPRTTDAPWASIDEPTLHATTASSAFNASFGSSARRAELVSPRNQLEWPAMPKPLGGRSTAQDSYLNMGGGPRQMVPPRHHLNGGGNQYEPNAAFAYELIAHERKSYPPYDVSTVRPPQPFTHARRDEHHNTKTGSTTQLDSFIPFRQEFIVPKSRRGLCRPVDHVGECTTPSNVRHDLSTNKADYVSHTVAPYMPAPKQVSVLGRDGEVI